jgi:hypothetical protein
MYTHREFAIITLNTASLGHGSQAQGQAYSIYVGLILVSLQQS